VKPGATAVVVGDGAVGLCGVIAAKELGAERVIAMSRHESRQKLATEFGATDLVTERGDDGVARIKDLTGGIGPDGPGGYRGHPEVVASTPQSYDVATQQRLWTVSEELTGVKFPVG
jgi:threonine dehydrogenase-like Zn-dependent dehydrogenase